MVKTLAAGLQDHLDSGSTTMAYCWRLTRNDGIIQGFTEHDRAMSFDGTTFEASSGFTASAMATELGLNVDNLNADGAISSDAINDDDLAAGLYDAAVVELFWVNFENTDQRVLMMKGTVGEVKRGDTVFSAELRSQTHLLQQKTGLTYTRYCDADLGDSRCGVNLADPAHTSTGAVTAVASNRILSVSGLANNTEAFYSLGKLVFTSGANDTLEFDVKVHSPVIGSSNAEIALWEKPPFTILATDTFEIFAGCQKDQTTCRTKFDNILNFRGFHLIPGNDFVTRYPSKGGADQDGGSIFKG